MESSFFDNFSDDHHAEKGVFAEMSPQSITDDDGFTFAVKHLWSSDAGKRQIGKEEIVRLGPKVVPKLIALLEDIRLLERIRDNPEKEYQLGEERVSRIWDHYIDLPVEQKNSETLMRVISPEIAWRLQNDVYELFGRLHSVEAVPTLIKIMEHEQIYFKLASMSGEMQALVKIGPPAVPHLIEAIETAEERAASIQFGGSQPTEEEKGRYIMSEAAKIRAKVARVLGEIGDVRAVPVLEKLLAASNELNSWRPDKPYIEEAINKIKEKSSFVR